jgi:hypothetical protein
MVVFKQIGRDGIVSVYGSYMREGLLSWSGCLDRSFYSFYGKDANWRGLRGAGDHSLPRWLMLRLKCRLVILFDETLLGDFHHLAKIADL